MKILSNKGPTINNRSMWYPTNHSQLVKEAGTYFWPFISITDV